MLGTSLLDLVGDTPIVEISALSSKPGVCIYAKLEGQNPTGSVKDRIAKFMVEAAESDGRLRPGQTILEPTSGNTGISLALIGGLRGYPVKVVMPDAVSEERTELLRALGAEIIYSPGELGSNGAVAMAQKIAAEHPDWYMPFQYENEEEPPRPLRDDRPRDHRRCARARRLRRRARHRGHADRRGAAAEGVQPWGASGGRRSPPGRPRSGPAQPGGRLHPAGLRRDRARRPHRRRFREFRSAPPRN